MTELLPLCAAGRQPPPDRGDPPVRPTAAEQERLQHRMLLPSATGPGPGCFMQASQVVLVLSCWVPEVSASPLLLRFSPRLPLPGSGGTLALGLTAALCCGSQGVAWDAARRLRILSVAVSPLVVPELLPLLRNARANAEPSSGILGAGERVGRP